MAASQSTTSLPLVPVTSSTEIQFNRVPVGLKRNYEIRCEAVDIRFGTTGEDGMPCGKPTVQCPGCGYWSESCPDHLFQQPNGISVCAECDGSPEFKVNPAVPAFALEAAR